MKSRKHYQITDIKEYEQPKQGSSFRTIERNPELIEKFYKQIINSFGYAYPAKM